MDLHVLTTTIAGGGGFAIGAVSSYLSLRQRTTWAPLALRIAAIVALTVNLVYFLRAVGVYGPIQVFTHNFESTILLATLIGFVGICTHVSANLRGLDGFLFILAAVAQFSALTVVGYEKVVVSDKPWFISHPLAFAVSGTCFAAGGAAGLAYLLVNRLLRRKQASSLVGVVAPLESLERFGRWMLITGFPLFTYGILTGICGIYHSASNGGAGRGEWFLDPVVILSAVTWLVYGYLFWSLLFRPKIRGRRAARLATAGMGLVAVVFLVIEFVSPLHR